MFQDVQLAFTICQTWLCSPFMLVTAQPGVRPKLKSECRKEGPAWASLGVCVPQILLPAAAELRNMGPVETGGKDNEVGKLKIEGLCLWRVILTYPALTMREKHQSYDSSSSNMLQELVEVLV